MKKISIVLFLSLLLFTSCSSDDGDGAGQGSDITLTCSPDKVDAPVVGGSYVLNVNCSRGEWTAYADDNSKDWIKVNVSGSTSTQGTVTVTVAANTGTESRSGSVVVKSGAKRVTIPVMQAVPMQVEKSTIYSVSTGETILVGIKASKDFTVKSNDSWISADIVNGVTTSFSTDGPAVRIKTDVNSAMTSRTGTVDVMSGEEKVTITVIQNSAEDANIETPAGYHLVWHDEFNEGTMLNSKDWTHEVQNAGWVNHELQTYVNGQADGKRVTELVDGRLHINCFKGSDGKIYSGRVYAKVKEGWTYGYIEASIKLPKGKGTWPAFWMMPVNFRSWPADGEIDIMEEVGYHPDYVSSSLHANAHVHSNGTQVTHEMYCPGAEGEFHKYAIEWTHDKITTFVDGKVQLTYNNRGLGRDDWPYDDPFYVILNLAWGGDWGGSQGVDESALPVTMEVDYVRVFQK